MLFSYASISCCSCWMPIVDFMGFDCVLMTCEDRKVTAQDLRLKLQKKGLHPGGQTGKSSVPRERDLRERLSGTMTPQPKNYDPPKPKVATKPSGKSIDVETPSVHNKRSANPTPKNVSRKVYCWHILCLLFDQDFLECSSRILVVVFVMFCCPFCLCIPLAVKLVIIFLKQWRWLP